MTVVIQTDDDINKVSTLLEKYEIASGAKINQKKTKLLWLERTPTPTTSYNYTDCENMKILGMICCSNFNQTVNENWQSLANKVRGLLLDTHLKTLNLHQRIEFVNIYALSRLWYIAQILPLPCKFSAQIKQYTGWFIWNRHFFRVHRDQLTLQPIDGGLGLVNIQMKANALLFRNIFRSLSPDCQQKELFKFAWNVKHISTNRNNSSNSINIPKSFSKSLQQAHELLKKLPKEQHITTAALYAQLQSDSNHTPRVTTKHMDLHWKTIWRNISDTAVPSSIRSALYIFVNDLTPTSYRRYQIRLEDDMRCSICGSEDTAEHRLISCSAALPIWTWITTKLCRMLGNINEHPRDKKMLYTDLNPFPSARRRAVVWLIGNYIMYMSETQGDANLTEFIDFIHRERWNVIQSESNSSKYGPYLCIL